MLSLQFRRLSQRSFASVDAAIETTSGLYVEALRENSSRIAEQVRNTLYTSFSSPGTFSDTHLEWPTAHVG